MARGLKGRGRERSPNKHHCFHLDHSRSKLDQYGPASEFGHAVSTIMRFCSEGNARFDRCQTPPSGWKVRPSRSEVPMTADTPPAQITEAD